jgi:hypothetical protein
LAKVVRRVKAPRQQVLLPCALPPLLTPPQMDELQEKAPMSNYTPFLLNGGILIVALVCLSMTKGYDGILVILFAPLLIIAGNGFLFIKALARRRGGLALAYLLVILGMVWFFASINLPGKIGG